MCLYNSFNFWCPEGKKKVILLLTMMKGISRGDNALAAEGVSASTGSNVWGSSSGGAIIRGRLDTGGPNWPDISLASRFPRLVECVTSNGTESTLVKASS